MGRSGLAGARSGPAAGSAVPAALAAGLPELRTPGRPGGLWRHRTLVAALVRRDLAARWGRGGKALFWCLASPAALLVVHAALGLGVLRLEWQIPGLAAGPASWLALALGVLVFSTFAEIALGAPGLISRYPGLVKRVAFPLETLVAARVLCAVAAALPAAFLWLAAASLAGAPVGAGLALLPLLAAPVALAALAVAYGLAALGPFFPDSTRSTGLAVHGLHLLTPVVYPLALLTPLARALALGNPIAVSIEEGRSVLLAGAAPDLPLLATTALVWGLAAAAARAVFLRVEKGFADVV